MKYQKKYQKLVQSDNRKGEELFAFSSPREIPLPAPTRRINVSSKNLRETLLRYGTAAPRLQTIEIEEIENGSWLDIHF